MKKNHDHSVEIDFGKCQFCTNRFVFLSFNVIKNYPHVKYVDYVLLFFHNLYSFKTNLCLFLLSICKSNTPLTSVIMNLQYFTSKQKWIKSNKRYLIRCCFHIDIILRIIGCKMFGFHDWTTFYIEFRYFVLSKLKCNNQ